MTNKAIKQDESVVETVEDRAIAASQEFQMPAEQPQYQMQTQSDQMMVLIEKAVLGEASLEKMEKLLEMKERYDEKEEEKRLAAKAEAAKDAYVAAMVKFKAEDLTIYKDKLVDFQSAKGRTTYMHASIGNVCRTIVTGLAKHGFSHNWIPEQLEDGRLKVTCVLTHEQGHSESISLTAGADQTGNKNNIQAINSTKTYLERYTLLDITGVATLDQEDNDGYTPTEPVELISEEQSLQIHAKITDNEFPMQIFMDWLTSAFVGVAKIDDIPAEYFDKVIHKLDVSIKARKANG